MLRSVAAGGATRPDVLERVRGVGGGGGRSWAEKPRSAAVKLLGKLRRCVSARRGADPALCLVSSSQQSGGSTLQCIVKISKMFGPQKANLGGNPPGGTGAELRLKPCDQETLGRIRSF